MGTVSAEFNSDHIVLRAPAAMRDLVKQVPGVRYDQESRDWRAPVSWGVCQALRGVFGDDLEVGEALTAWGWRELDERIKPVLELRAAADAHGDSRLWPFQRVMVAFTKRAGSALNGSQMRLGKTVETIRDMVETGSTPALVVCNNTMKEGWRDELVTWADGRLEVVVLRGGAAKIRKLLDEPADVYVVNWEALRSFTHLAGFGSIRLKRCPEHGGVDDSVTESKCEVHPKELNREWKLVVADEAHRAKDPRAKQTRALWAVGGTATRRLALTGTPIANSPEDLWSVLHFVEPDDWPAKSRFLDRYCMVGLGAFGGIEVLGLRPDTRDEFFRILDPRYKRDTRKEHMDIPTVYTYRIVEMNPKQTKAYKQMRDTMLAELDGGEAVATNPLARHVRLSQFASAYAEVAPDGKITLTEPSCKIDALEEVLEELGDQQAVVFAESIQLIDLAEKRVQKLKLTYGRITGNESDRERDEVKNQFQAGDLQLVLATLGAGSESITLNAAGVEIFLQRSWSLVKNLQAEDRNQGIGQVRDHVEVIDIVAKDTLEEGKLRTIGQKEERLHEITRDPQQLYRLLSYGK